MARLTLGSLMLSFQGKMRILFVIEGDRLPVLFNVAAPAVFAKVGLVMIVYAMAGNAGLGRSLIAAIGMAGFAACRDMRT